ncbi:MAG: biotin--[acetyl-CoA-carboxylase] ligase [Sediminibacterium sp.]
MPPIAAKSPIGQPFVELPEVDSTNIYAMERLQTNIAAHGTVYFAHNQLAGKGRQGKSWHAEPGTNITMSVIIRPSFLPLTQQFRLSVMVAVACHAFFSKYAAAETKIKWPNDIYWRDRKAGGILIENLVRGNKWQGAVAGIGININQAFFPGLLHNPVSLKQITGKHYDVVALGRELSTLLEQHYVQLEAGGFEQLLDRYNLHLYRRGQETQLKKGNIGFNCTILGVNADGELLVSGGIRDRFQSGEVTWVIGE